MTTDNNNTTDEFLYKALEKLIKYENSLEYKYYIRDYIYKYKIIPGDVIDDSILNIADSCFKYYTQHKNVFKQDISLSAITSLCSNDIHKYDPEITDDTVSILSKYFNEAINSSRQLYGCYDCGTMARAFFLSLLKAHRGSHLLYPFEIARMKSMYYSVTSDCINRIKDLYHVIMNITVDTVFICSIGLNLSGHVFILEKRIINNASVYRLYQTCLNAYSILDYIEHQDYAINIHKSINIANFFSNLIHLFGIAKWTEEEKVLFTKLFCYLPDHEISNENENFSFCWTYISYSSLA